MSNLHFSIDADCSGAIDALNAVASKADQVSRVTPSLALSVSGADSAIAQLSSVGSAMSALSAPTALGLDSRSVVAAQSEVSSLRGGVQGLSRDMSALSGLNFGVGSGSSISQLAGDLGGLSRAFGGLGGDARSSIGGLSSDVQRELGGTSVALKSATADAREFAEVSNAVRNGGTSGGRYSRGPGGGSGGGRGDGPWGFGGSRDSDPPDLFGGDGRGLGGDAARGGSREGGMHGAGMPAVMASAIGVVESLGTGAAGLMAVNEAIKHTPDLAYAANQAMGQFGKGIRQAASSAIAEGVPALHQLGSVLHGLGDEVGAVGGEHLGTGLAAVSSLAGSATTALSMMDPAIDSSIKGLAGLGNAALTGISNPTVVQGIKNVGDALSNPQNEQGIANLVSGLSAVSTLAGKVAVDVGGSLGALTGLGGDAVTPAIQGGIGFGAMTKSPTAGALAALSILQSQYEESQGRSDLVTPGTVGGAAGGFGANQLAGKAGLKGWKKGGVTAGGYLAGDAAGVGSRYLDKAAGTGGLFQDMTEYGLAGASIGAAGGPWGAVGGFLLGTAAGFAKNSLAGDENQSAGDKSDTDANGFPTSVTAVGAQNAARYGWQEDDKGNMRPGTAGDRGLNTHLAAVRHAQGMASGGNAMPSLAHGGSKPDDSGTRFPGFSDLFKGGLAPGSGSGMRVLPQSAVQQLNQASAGMQQLQQTTSSVAPPMQQIGQQATQSGVQMSQMAQHTAAQAAAIQHLNQVTSPTMNSLQQIPQQANTAMSQAQSSMVSGGNQMGAAMPQSVSQGIHSGQSQVCDASQNMMQGAADCASSAGGIQSPSTVFNYFGQMLGAGLAQGISGSSGMAAGAAGAAMMNVSDVAANYAGNAGLNLGTVFGTNLVSGINTTIKSSALKATGLAQGVDSPLAKMALGQLGLLGKAGSGAQSWDLLNNAGVASFGSGTPANPAPPQAVQVTVHNYLDGKLIQPVAQQVVETNLKELQAALSGARR